VGYHDIYRSAEQQLRDVAEPLLIRAAYQQQAEAMLKSSGPEERLRV